MFTTAAELREALESVLASYRNHRAICFKTLEALEKANPSLHTRSFSQLKSTMQRIRRLNEELSDSVASSRASRIDPPSYSMSGDMGLFRMQMSSYEAATMRQRSSIESNQGTIEGNIREARESLERFILTLSAPKVGW